MNFVFVLVLPETKESILEKPSHPIKSGSSVFITNFENFNSIFIRDASYEFIENFNAFNKTMLKYYRNGKNNFIIKHVYLIILYYIHLTFQLIIIFLKKI